MSEPTKAPVLRVVAGSPTPDEVAVVVSVLHAVAAGAVPQPGPVRMDAWSDHARRMCRRPAPGPTTWRVSGLPM